MLEHAISTTTRQAGNYQRGSWDSVIPTGPSRGRPGRHRSTPIFAHCGLLHEPRQFAHFKYKVRQQTLAIRRHIFCIQYRGKGAHSRTYSRHHRILCGEHQVQTRKIYNRICGKTVDRVGQHQRINQSSWSLSTVSSIELVSLNGHIDRVGQSQRHHRSSWSVSTVSSIELVSLNGIIGRVGQRQRIYQGFNRTIARSTERVRRGTASRASRCFANTTSSAHLISLPSTPDSQPAMHTAYWLETNHT